MGSNSVRCMFTHLLGTQLIRTRYRRIHVKNEFIESSANGFSTDLADLMERGHKLDVFELQRQVLLVIMYDTKTVFTLIAGRHELLHPIQSIPLPWRRSLIRCACLSLVSVRGDTGHTSIRTPQKEREGQRERDNDYREHMCICIETIWTTNKYNKDG